MPGPEHVRRRSEGTGPGRREGGPERQAHHSLDGFNGSVRWVKGPSHAVAPGGVRAGAGSVI
ncbi:hypothetical protein GCM10022419_107840 [Nonomuraea rosea]|uniref:Uncharacterized protein n=1 Tax=Nonomuraea rosea TaxID=638574 RepID=A0ABP6ZCN0_9ACTN